MLRNKHEALRTEGTAEVMRTWPGPLRGFQAHKRDAGVTGLQLAPSSYHGNRVIGAVHLSPGYPAMGRSRCAGTNWGNIMSARGGWVRTRAVAARAADLQLRLPAI